MQDSPTRSTTKRNNPAALSGGAAFGGAAPALRGGAAWSGTDRRERLRVLLLGTNLWVLCVLWPAWSARTERSIDVAFETLGLLPLVLGAVLDGSPGWRAAPFLRPALWLVVFPTALAAALALRAERVNQELFGPLALCLLGLSLCAYVAAVASTMGKADGPALPVTHQALGAEPWDAPPREHGLRRRLFIGVCLAGAAALALVAPRAGGFGELEQAYGPSALLGAMLSAVVGTALGVTLLSTYLGQGLRPATAHDPDADTALRTVWFLFLALLGGVTYAIVQP